MFPVVGKARAWLIGRAKFSAATDGIIVSGNAVCAACDPYAEASN